jgi:death-on-curing protein
MATTLLQNKDVETEYRRWLSEIGPSDPYISKVTIGIHEVLQAHFLLVDFFHSTGEGIGGVGPKKSQSSSLSSFTAILLVWRKA